MKKAVNIAFIYAIAAMVGGVFYREFTKFNGFNGRTSLGFVHTHLFLLGMIFFLVTGLIMNQFAIEKSKKFKVFMITYNIGVPMTAVMLIVRGIIQVLAIPVSKGMDAAVSGIAGIGHILLGVGIVCFFLALKEAISLKPKA